MSTAAQDDDDDAGLGDGRRTWNVARVHPTNRLTDALYPPQPSKYELWAGPSPPCCCPGPCQPQVCTLTTPVQHRQICTITIPVQHSQICRIIIPVQHGRVCTLTIPVQHSQVCMMMIPVQHRHR